MNSQIALTSVVTASVLEEFKFLKFSFELFHGDEYQWFLRCDRASMQALSAYPNVVCESFTDVITKRPDIESIDYRNIVGEKMKALEAAWGSGDWASVLYFDSDIIITAPAIEVISAVGGDLVLTPNYYPESTKHLASLHGIYNGGFICTRNRRFHRWWRDAFISQPHRWTDQACLNDAPHQFTIGTLSERANIGFWRSANIPLYEPIPADCEFLHAHLFQPLVTIREWMDKTFSLHCLKFLRGSPIPEHRRLLSEALARDESRWYEASLRLC
jgi:hypothetical protein